MRRRRTSLPSTTACTTGRTSSASPSGTTTSRRRTSARRSATLEKVEALDDDALGSLIPVLSGRFDSVALEARREGWPERRFANVWGQNPFPISDDEDRFLRAVDGRTTVGQLASGADDVKAFRRLAQRGALELLDPAAG